MLAFNTIQDKDLLVTINRIRWYIGAMLMPAEMITCFELIYLVHKKRNTNFCGLKFDVSGDKLLRSSYIC